MKNKPDPTVQESEQVLKGKKKWNPQKRKVSKWKVALVDQIACSSDIKETWTI